MSTKHTEGTVRLGKTGEDIAILLGSENGNYICTVQIKQQGGGAIAAVMEDIRRANANHLVLCWNSHDDLMGLLSNVIKGVDIDQAAAQLLLQEIEGKEIRKDGLK